MGKTAPMIAYDIETLSTYDNSVILSLGAVAFNPEEEHTFDSLVSNGVFVKFEIKEQAKVHGRHIKPSTVDWWKKASPHAREKSLLPNPKLDCNLKEGFELFQAWLDSVDYDPKKSVVWVRGSLDFSATQHACEENLQRDSIIPYNMIRDARTYIDTAYGSSNGYVKTSKSTVGCIKHDPVHDSALDAMMILYGIQE